MTMTGERAWDNHHSRPLGLPSQASADGTAPLREKVEALLAQVAQRLPKDESGNVLPFDAELQDATEVHQQALWNYWLVNNGGRYGIRDASLAIQVLQRTSIALGRASPRATPAE